MLRIIITIYLLIFNVGVYAQDSNNGHAIVIMDMPTKGKRTPAPLYIIKADHWVMQISTQGTSTNSRKVKRIFKDFKPEWINSMEVLKDKSVIEKYGPSGRYGVVTINLKGGTFSQLPAKLRKYARREQ